MKEAARMAVVEICELVLPPFYLASFCVAYFGPNANMMGGVKASIWHYTGGEHLAHVATHIAIMTACDSVVVLMTLWLFRRHNLRMFNYYAKCIDTFWLPVALTQCWMIDHQFCVTVLHCAMDYTFKFDWIRTAATGAEQKLRHDEPLHR